MSKCGNRIYGLDTENGLRRIHVDEALSRYRKKPFYIQCEICSGKLFPKCGEIRQHHFAHSFLRKKEDAPRIVRKTPPPGGPSEWHKQWQRVFPDRYREKKDPFYTQEDGRRADILFDEEKVVIEFQKGEFGIDGSKDTCQVRNDFWTGQGYDIIWLFADTESKEENLGFDFTSQKVRMYRPYHDRLFGEGFRITEHVEIHIYHGNDIFQLLPERYQENENMVSFPFVPSYLNEFEPSEQKELPIPYAKERLLTARKEAFERYKGCFDGKNEKPTQDAKNDGVELPDEDALVIRREIDLMRERTRNNKMTLDAIVSWANKIKTLNSEGEKRLSTVWVKNVLTQYEFQLYTKGQPNRGNMWGYMKRTASGAYVNDRVEIYGRNQPIWQLLG